ncbi:MAG TPA: ABC transporter ATP-binding protein [Blastocatellia bacterium]|nr:ABC transporter ATP-binding protein [Blastocatellia bacterium]
MPLLELRSVTKRFGGLTAVNALSFVVNEGETVSIIGPNGAGKTTVFNLITGFQRPTEGDVLLLGSSLVDKKPHQIARAGIGRTFQVVKPFGGMTVFENVLVGAYGRTSDRGEARRIASETMEFTGLKSLGDRLAKGLPLAMRKRLELARSLAFQPRLILLDEVAAGLNPVEVREAADLILRLRDEKGVSAVAGVEHVMHVVMSISDRVIVLNYGKKIAEGKPAEVANDREVITAYLGE